MIAVIPVRDGVLPVGADEAVAECSGEAIVIGSGCREAAAGLLTTTREARLAEVGPYAPAAWGRALAPHVDERGVVLLPASPDGRDLAPHLAHALGRPLWAGATSVTGAAVTVSRHGGRTLATAALGGPIVATLLPGTRAVEPRPSTAPPPLLVELPLALDPAPAAETREVLAPTGASMALGDATRIVAGGAGLGDPGSFDLLTPLGERLDAAVGATRVVVDRGWIGHDRQIGTTGVVVAPTLYLAFGVSGAVQHLAAVAPPAHTIAVDTDPSCPMMGAADLAVVADAPATLRALLDELGAPDPGGGADRG